LSQSDELTGLRNRHALRYDFDLFVHRDIAVMMLDVDHFKAFNDHYGHEVGDMVMKICGQAIREEFRNCYAYRYGGDEILIVSLMDNYTQMEESFDTMMQTLEEMCAKQSVPSVIFSYGIACGFADNPEDVRDYFKWADRLMYINKTEHHTLEEDDA
jgi:diguanylate cyclase (GGDEF)-like protein